VVGAVATVGIAVGSSVPMFLGAMIVGPLTAFLLKLWDDLVGERVSPGFKMLVDNFSAGIIAGAMAVLACSASGPPCKALTKLAGSGVQALINAHLLPLASIIIEPGKVLFLKQCHQPRHPRAVGVAQAAIHGKAIEFLMEPNPGPRLGILLACLLFGPRVMRRRCPVRSSSSPGRHPRDLLPVRAGPAEADPGRSSRPKPNSAEPTANDTAPANQHAQDDAEVAALRVTASTAMICPATVSRSSQHR